jgi:hypothetical protein
MSEHRQFCRSPRATPSDDRGAARARRKNCARRASSPRCPRSRTGDAWPRIARYEAQSRARACPAPRETAAVTTPPHTLPAARPFSGTADRTTHRHRRCSGSAAREGLRRWAASSLIPRDLIRSVVFGADVGVIPRARGAPRRVTSGRAASGRAASGGAASGTAASAGAGSGPAGACRQCLPAGLTSRLPKLGRTLSNLTIGRETCVQGFLLLNS